MSIIFVDTETTGLLQPTGTEMQYQPHLIEICAIKTNDKLDVIGKFNSFIKPPIPIPEKLTKTVHGISDKMVEKAPIFIEVYRPLCELFLGCHTFVAHNASFDLGMLFVELRRLNSVHKFPWPPIHFCTVEQTLHFKGYRLKLAELYELATDNKEIPGAHRAENDVLALIECYRWLKCM